MVLKIKRKCRTCMAKRQKFGSIVYRISDIMVVYQANSSIIVLSCNWSRVGINIPVNKDCSLFRIVVLYEDIADLNDVIYYVI